DDPDEPTASDEPTVDEATAPDGRRRPVPPRSGRAQRRRNGFRTARADHPDAGAAALGAAQDLLHRRVVGAAHPGRHAEPAGEPGDRPGDRKSTRLNSSHQIISYAV